jgi:hypothetical protein
VLVEAVAHEVVAEERGVVEEEVQEVAVVVAVGAAGK